MPPAMPDLDLDLLWGAKAIARAAGCSTLMVHQMRQVPGCPIRQMRVNGKLFVSRLDLGDWLRSIGKTEQNATDR